MTKPSRWEDAERLCFEALQRAPGERAVFLRDACGGDDALRQEVESLLVHELTAAPYLETPAANIAVRGLARDRIPNAKGISIDGYEIVGLLGAGGMGEVYRARDLKLGRAVAIKILPSFLSADPERLSRFAREARVLATLNHPHVGAIYGLEDRQPGARALILELVEGETLDERIARGPIPVAQARAIAGQIAEALEAAHEKGIVHRDLKPSNVKITPAGIVKVLDFGLAKAGSGVVSDVLSSSFATVGTTREGSVLGTAAYMSPEQARGDEVDKRADIWAFGCVLYEMLTGRTAFGGRTMADTLAGILEREPSWDALPNAVPSRVRALLRRCLQKDPARRLRDIADARFELEDDDEPESPQTTTGRPSSNARIAWSLALMAAVAAVGIGAFVFTRPAPASPQVYRSSLLPPDGVNWSSAIPAIRFALSPDGRRLVFVATSADGRVQLWVRSLDALTAQPLAGTDGAAMPFWSPDSRTIGFNAGGKLKKISASGGPPVTLADQLLNNNGAWSPEDVIVFLPTGAGPLVRISADGGEMTQVTTLDTESGDALHWNPFFLPDGRHFLYFAVGSKTGGPTDARAIYVASLETSEKSRLLLQGGSNAKYADGHLLFMRDRTLMAQPFDPDRRELSGEAVAVAEGVEIGGTTGRTGAFSVSQTGVLAYQAQPGSAGLRSQLLWFDRAGKVSARLEDPGEYQDINLSPDGTRAVVSLGDPVTKVRDIWLLDLTRGVRSRLTFNPFDELSSIWSPDGSQVMFSSNRNDFAAFLQKASGGAGEEIQVPVEGTGGKGPLSWSPDGQFVLYGAGNPFVLWARHLTGDQKSSRVSQALGEVESGQFSPDGRWIAYASNESGNSEVYVIPVPWRPVGDGTLASTTPAAGKWQVSTTGGHWPRWGRDGNELFYLAPNDMLMAAAVNGRQASFSVTGVRPLFPTHPRAQVGLYAGYNYDVSADGQRFLVNTLVDQAPPAPITLVFNWAAGLKK